MVVVVAILFGGLVVLTGIAFAVIYFFFPEIIWEVEHEETPDYGDIDVDTTPSGGDGSGGGDTGGSGGGVLSGSCPESWERKGNICEEPCPDEYEDTFDEVNVRVCYAPCPTGRNMRTDGRHCRYEGCSDNQFTWGENCYKKCQGNREPMRLSDGTIICSRPCPTGYTREGRECHIYDQEPVEFEYAPNVNMPQIEAGYVAPQGRVVRCRLNDGTSYLASAVIPQMRRDPNSPPWIHDFSNWQCLQGGEMYIGCLEKARNAGFNERDYRGNTVCVKCPTGYKDNQTEVSKPCRPGSFDAKTVNAIYKQKYNRTKDRESYYPKTEVPS